jgi:hypothetical protein
VVGGPVPNGVLMAYDVPSDAVGLDQGGGAAIHDREDNDPFGRCRFLGCSAVVEGDNLAPIDRHPVPGLQIGAERLGNQPLVGRCLRPLQFV